MAIDIIISQLSELTNSHLIAEQLAQNTLPRTIWKVPIAAIFFVLIVFLFIFSRYLYSAGRRYRSRQRIWTVRPVNTS